MNEKYIAETLRPCRVCGWSEFGIAGFADIVHCTCCGALYFVNPDEVGAPVAESKPRQE